MKIVKKFNLIYETFRLVFYYIMELDNPVLLNEINEIAEKTTGSVGVEIRHWPFGPLLRIEQNDPPSRASDKTATKAIALLSQFGFFPIPAG